MSTGLYWYSSRAYNPVLCRFVQPDTIVPDYNNPQSLNRYSYGYNNPVKYVDPTGHDAEDWFGDSWKEEFQEAHSGEDPQAGDYAYRLVTMAIASGMGGDGGGDGSDGGGEGGPYTVAIGAFGGSDDGLNRALTGAAEALDWTDLTLTTATASLTPVVASAGPIGPAMAVALNVASNLVTFGLDLLSTTMVEVADVRAGRTGFAVTDNSISWWIGADSIMSSFTSAAAGPLTPTPLSLPLDGGQVAYDRLRANGMPGYSFRYKLRW